MTMSGKRHSAAARQHMRDAKAWQREVTAARYAAIRMALKERIAAIERGAAPPRLWRELDEEVGREFGRKAAVVGNIRRAAGWGPR